MNRVVKFGLIGLALIAALSWWISDDSRTLRCRRTFTVVTPEGTHSGSNVVEETVYFASGLARAQGYGVLRGLRPQATVVDLSGHPILFATLTDEDRLRSADTHVTGLGCETPFPREKFGGHADAGRSPNGEYAAYLDGLNKQKPRGDVPSSIPSDAGALRDIHEPSSVERVLIHPISRRVSGLASSSRA